MNDLELRALVRDAVARHLGGRGGAAASPFSAGVEPAVGRGGADPHPSHAVYLTVVNMDNACVIEPAVSCNHCNYCKSHGH